MKVGPDLLVTVLTAPTLAAAGNSINVTDTTANQGAGPAAVSSTAFYLSTNSVFDAKQKTAYEITFRDWSSDVCSSDLRGALVIQTPQGEERLFAGVVRKYSSRSA